MIKLREERQLLGRFLIIQGSRPELLPRLKTIGEYEMSVIPRSICALDGALYIPGDKASLMHAIEEAVHEHMDFESSCRTTPVGHPYRILIIDAMAVLQSIKKRQTMVTIVDLQSAFIKQIELLVSSYLEARLVFDNYLDQSLKNKSRQKQAVSSIEFEINIQMKLTLSMKDMLYSTRSKQCLTKMFVQALLEKSGSSLSLVVVCGNKIKSRDFEEEHWG